jgi:hypothetical protein
MPFSIDRRRATSSSGPFRRIVSEVNSAFILIPDEAHRVLTHFSTYSRRKNALARRRHGFENRSED